MVDRPDYLAPWLNDIVPGTAQQFMYAVEVVEIVAGSVVALAPWFGGYLVAAWLGGINRQPAQVDAPEYYDIALRDFGLLPGAFTLARLASASAKVRSGWMNVGISRRQPRSSFNPGRSRGLCTILATASAP